MKTKTFLRYFLSYFLVLCTLLISFSSIFRTQLIKNYSTQQKSSINERLTIVSEQFINCLSSISLTHTLLRNNAALSDYNYERSAATRHTLYLELCKYDATNPYVDAIIILNKKDGDVLTSNYIAKYTDGLLDIYDRNGSPNSLDMNDNDTSHKNALVSLQDMNSEYLLYLPNDIDTAYTFIYIINLTELTKMFKNNLIEGISSFVLITPDRSHMYGINTDQVRLDLIDTFTESGIHEYQKNLSICFDADIYQGYSMCALFSDEVFTSQMHDAFNTAYLSLFILCIIGIVIIFLCMRLTYYPLKTIVNKHVTNPTHNYDFLEQLDNAFFATTNEKKHLQEKIDKYHLSIQKALLSSNIDNNTLLNFQNIDDIITTDLDNCVYLVRIRSVNNRFAEKEILDFLKSNLSENSASVIFETGSDYRVYLINYASAEPNKDEVIYSLMYEIHDKFGYYCAISDMGTTIIDIPALYENTLEASRHWSHAPVISFSSAVSLNTTKENASSLYKLLENLSNALKTFDFKESHIQLKLLLSQIEQLLIADSDYPIFIIRSIIIEILMTLFISMNQNNVNFKLYDDLYYETLFYSRSHDLYEKKKDITNNLIRLLEIFESEHQLVRTNQIAIYLEENLSSENLSITTLADHFHVSVAYMSYLFKKEFNENFIDHLWNLRFQKASEMLLNTELPIDTISVLVGYVNPSSFRRKFKQETGLTPSQYRNSVDAPTNKYLKK